MAPTIGTLQQYSGQNGDGQNVLVDGPVASDVADAVTKKHANPSNATDEEIIAGTSTTIRNTTPAQLKLAAETHGGSTGPVDYVQFTTTEPPPAHSEALLYYNQTEHCHVAYNDEADISQCLGREFFKRCYNSSGSVIPNGTLVYMSTATGGLPAISLAQANTYVTSRDIGMTTHEIAIDSPGYVTRMGEVHDVDTSGYPAGTTLYLSPTTPGAFTGTRPDGENWRIPIGQVVVSDAVTGSIDIDPTLSEYSAEMVQHIGFPAEAEEEASLSFVDGTRTFSITPIGDDFHFYQSGVKYLKLSAETLIITDVTGLHIIYYDEGVLAESVNPTVAQVIALLSDKVFVSYVYWNAVAGYALLVGEERHHTASTGGFTPKNHVYTHIHTGAVYTSGLAIADIVSDGNGSLAAHAQFGIGAGSFSDEDIDITVDAVASTAGMTYWYKSGASGIWAKGTNAGYNFPVGATPLPQYNQWTGATWQLTEVPTGDFMLIHVFGVNSIDTSDNAICILGQEAYPSLATARAAAATRIFLFNRDTLPMPEYVPVATVILECKTGFTNAVNARVVETATGGDYEDFRTTTGIPATGTGGTTPPGGLDTQIQYNAAGVFTGSADMTFNSATSTFTATNIATAGAAITGGSVTGITDLAVADGGTGASDASGARTNLGAAPSALSIPGTDLTAIGTTQTVTVGEGVAFGNLLYLKSDGKWWLADADAATTMPAMRMALATASADASCSTLVSGIARNDAWNWTVGAVLHVSDTAGAIVATAPSGTGDQVQRIGVALTADVVAFAPSLNIAGVA